MESDLVSSIVVIGDSPPAIPDPKVQHLPLAAFPFCKTIYLNYGLREVNHDFVLVSDADIIWNTETLEAFSCCLSQHPNAIAHVNSVGETAAITPSLQRKRWTVALTQAEGQQRLSFFQDISSTHSRPGYGLVAAHLETFMAIGGYNEALKGWGWEDLDLLIRAQLLGHPVYALGSVLHMSHGDALRNQGYEETPQSTRDRNILISASAIARGKLYGSLCSQQVSTQLVHVELPPELLTASCNT